MKVAIIPARGGSTRIPRKNIRDFHGKPIIAHSIETAKASGLFDEIFVTTDDFEIAEISERYGAHALRRPAELAIDEVGTQEVMRWVLQEALSRPPSPIDYVCCIYATAPMMLTEDLDFGWKLLQAQPKIDFAYSVGSNPTRDAGQWYWGKAEAFLTGVPLDPRGENVLKCVIPNERVCDINTEADWQRAEQMYADLYNLNEGIPYG